MNGYTFKRSNYDFNSYFPSLWVQLLKFRKEKHNYFVDPSYKATCKPENSTSFSAAPDVENAMPMYGLYLSHLWHRCIMEGKNKRDDLKGDVGF